ncbi:MAG: 50S ribosomal protein L18e, partial [Candidatus Aenigmarchaeota archaeon]|nr:50S ribosomal protein L18e [Candidatus Aenigmarchaeota archaeon]
SAGATKKNDVSSIIWRVVIMPKPTGPTNPEVLKIVNEMRRKRIYKDVARQLIKPSRRKKGVNVEKIDNAACENEIIVIPGDCLGSGEITKKVTVYALRFSASAKKKIEMKGGRCLPISRLPADNAKGRVLI